MPDEERIQDKDPEDFDNDSRGGPVGDLRPASSESAEGLDADHEEGVTLEELSQSYARVVGLQEPTQPTGEGCNASVGEDEPSPTESVDGLFQVSPLSIVEAVLFVGRPDNRGIPAHEIAKLMRGVSEPEVVALVAELNQTYSETGRAMRIVEASDGYRTVLADEVDFIRDRFYGRVREVALNQSAIDCLALVAYQPGISRNQLEEQRGQPSGGILNQLVRRRLIEIHRKGDGKDSAPHYYPTDRLVALAGLDSLDDLPQVEDLELD